MDSTEVNEKETLLSNLEAEIEERKKTLEALQTKCEQVEDVYQQFKHREGKSIFNFVFDEVLMQ